MGSGNPIARPPPDAVGITRPVSTLREYARTYEVLSTRPNTIQTSNIYSILPATFLSLLLQPSKLKMRSLLTGVSLLLAATGLAAPMLPRRGLLNISPVISPDIDLPENPGCLGIGISVCDPITVDSKQRAEQKDNNGTSEKAAQAPPEGDENSDSLINIAPVIAPQVDGGDNTGCLGIGISACDPISVDDE